MAHHGLDHGVGNLGPARSVGEDHPLPFVKSRPAGEQAAIARSRPGSFPPNSPKSPRASTSDMLAVSASIAADTPTAPSDRPEGTDAPSSRLATTTHGLSVSGDRPRSSLPSCSSKPSS